MCAVRQGGRGNETLVSAALFQEIAQREGVKVNVYSCDVGYAGKSVAAELGPTDSCDCGGMR